MAQTSDRPRRARLVPPTALLLMAGLLTVGAPLAVGALSAEETIYTVEGDVQAPKRIAGEAPSYPEEARKERLEWLVVVRVVIDRQGNPTFQEVLKGENEEFVAEVRKALDTWKFEPATLGGEPVSVYYTLTFNFRLEEHPEGDEAG